MTIHMLLTMNDRGIRQGHQSRTLISKTDLSIASYRDPVDTYALLSPTGCLTITYWSIHIFISTGKNS